MEMHITIHSLCKKLLLFHPCLEAWLETNLLIFFKGAE